MTAEFATRARACVLRGGLRGGLRGRGRQNVRTWRIIIECLAIALEFDELLPEFNGVYCPRDSECLCLGPAQEAYPSMELQSHAYVNQIVQSSHLPTSIRLYIGASVLPQCLRKFDG